MKSRVDMFKHPIIGCNYHTKWQSNKSMRFVLQDVSEDMDKALLITRRTNKRFWTKVSDLIFIKSSHNINKAKNIINSW